MTMYCTHSFVPSNHIVLISSLYVSWCFCTQASTAASQVVEPLYCSTYTIYPSIAMGCAQSRHALPPQSRNHPGSHRKPAKPYDQDTHQHRPHQLRHPDGRARRNGERPIDSRREYRHHTKRNPRYDPVHQKKAEMRQAYDQNRDPIFRKHRKGYHDEWYF